MKIELNAARKKEIIQELILYFDRELDQNIGSLKAELFLDFCIDKLGAQIYNQALDDAGNYIREKLMELEDTLYQSD